MKKRPPPCSLGALQAFDAPHGVNDLNGNPQCYHHAIADRALRTVLNLHLQLSWGVSAYFDGRRENGEVASESEIGRPTQQLDAGLANEPKLFKVLLDWSSRSERNGPPANSSLAVFDNRRVLEAVRHRDRIA